MSTYIQTLYTCNFNPMITLPIHSMFLHSEKIQYLQFKDSPVSSKAKNKVKMNVVF